MSPSAAQTAYKVRAAALHKCALSSEKAVSIAWRSGGTAEGTAHLKSCSGYGVVVDQEDHDVAALKRRRDG